MTKKSNKKLLKYISLLCPTACIPAFLVSAKIKLHENKMDAKNEVDFLINSETITINRITNNINTLIFYKKIYDTSQNEYLLLIYEKVNAIIDLKTYTTLEINWKKYDHSKIKNNVIFYFGTIGLFIKDGENFINIETNEIKNKEMFYNVKTSNINCNSFQSLRDKNFKKRFILNNKKNSLYSINKNGGSSNNFGDANWKNNFEINVSTQVKYSWWFATRNSYKSAGYDELNGLGLCEYVALSQLYLYTELFVQPNIFNNEQFSHYIEINNDNSLTNSSPIFKYSVLDENKKSLAYDLYKLGGKYLNLKSGVTYQNISQKFITSKETLHNLEFPNKYGGYYRAWQSVKNGIPAILGVATFSGFNHALLVYGYDDETDMFLTSFCWGDEDSNKVLYSYYTGAWGSYYFAINSRYTNTSKFRKAFCYQNNEYTGEEIDKMLRK